MKPLLRKFGLHLDVLKSTEVLKVLNSVYKHMEKAHTTFSFIKALKMYDFAETLNEYKLNLNLYIS